MTDITDKAYALSLGLTPNRGNNLTHGKLLDLRGELTDEIRSFLEMEQRMRGGSKADPTTGEWDLTLHDSQDGFERARHTTGITDWRVWNQAYLIIGLLLEAIGYQVSYHMANEANIGK